MDDIHLFGVPQITGLHQERSLKIQAVLRPDAAPRPTGFGPAADFCLAHHALEGADIAARSGDRTAFDWYSAHPYADAEASATTTCLGQRIVVSPDPATLPRSPISETAYYVLGPDADPAPAALRTLTADAFSIAADTGFATLLANHAVVVVLLRAKQLGQTLDSWTITRLPGTVFLDHVGDAFVLARDLIHEAGHNWLNDALTATGIKIDDGIEFYSPWKQSMRPAFGFLHACWAFPLTMLYTAAALDRADGDVHPFLSTYLDKQRIHLAATTADHARALQLIDDEALRQKLTIVHQQALAL